VSQTEQDKERQRLFARNLRAAREQAGLTQASMATKLSMEDEVYARYERAKMWPSLDRLGRICDILGCTSDSLLGTAEPPPRPGLAPVQPPDDDSPDVRRLLRRLRVARPRTVRAVQRVLAALDRHAHPVAGSPRAQVARDNDDDAAPAVSSGNDATAAAGAMPGDDGGTGEP
jgi:transcriptional regulator with XRE-family HTH domain